MIPGIQKLFPVSPVSGDEIFNEVLSGKAFKLEHIQSFGEASPEGFWYDQEEDEWVALIAGESTLEFETGELRLQSCDAVLIPAHMKHRVKYTTIDAVWIALHFTS